MNRSRGVVAYRRGLDPEVDDEENSSLNMQNPSENNTSNMSYSRMYYQRNKERVQAYSREYSARARADPVKRDLINTQKRELMRNRAKRLKESPPANKHPAPRKKNSPDETTPHRRDHKKYYEQNKEKMRESNRKHYHKTMADPEKRAEFNLRKKLAMRRLKERRILEAGGTLPRTKDVYTENNTEEESPNSEVETTCIEEEEIPMGTFFVEEVELPLDGEEVEDESHAYLQEDEEVVQYETEEAEYSTAEESSSNIPEINIEEKEDELSRLDPNQIFPFATSAYWALQDEEKQDFVSYIEMCAKQYFQSTRNEIVEVEGVH